MVSARLPPTQHPDAPGRPEPPTPITPAAATGADTVQRPPCDQAASRSVPATQQRRVAARHGGQPQHLHLIPAEPGGQHRPRRLPRCRRPQRRSRPHPAAGSFPPPSGHYLGRTRRRSPPLARTRVPAPSRPGRTACSTPTSARRPPPRRPAPSRCRRRCSRARACPDGATASASGTSARAASSRPGVQVWPALLLVASGEKASPWLGRKPTTSEVLARVARGDQPAVVGHALPG